MLSKDDIIRELSANSVLFELIEHAAASTVEAQTEALASALPGHIIKNLFLKVRCACLVMRGSAESKDTTGRNAFSCMPGKCACMPRR